MTVYGLWMYNTMNQRLGALWGIVFIMFITTSRIMQDTGIEALINLTICQQIITVIIKPGELSVSLPGNRILTHTPPVNNVNRVEMDGLLA